MGHGDPGVVGDHMVADGLDRLAVGLHPAHTVTLGQFYKLSYRNILSSGVLSTYMNLTDGADKGCILANLDCDVLHVSDKAWLRSNSSSNCFKQRH